MNFTNSLSEALDISFGLKENKSEEDISKASKDNRKYLKLAAEKVGINFEEYLNSL